MLSIGGITYTDDWDAALATSPTQLGLNAADVAESLGVGIEIDYENSSSPNIEALAAFIAAYRSRHPYDPTGINHAARLTIDVAAGDRWLIALNRHATQNWLRPDSPVLDYANAMVSGTSSGTPTDWQEHVDGKPQYAPPVFPLAPARFTGALYLKGNIANCLNYGASEQKADANYVQKVLPNAVAFPTGDSLPACSATCSGRPARRRPAGVTFPPRTARAAWAWPREHSMFQSPCRRCGRSSLNRPQQAATLRPTLEADPGQAGDAQRISLANHMYPSKRSSARKRNR